MGTQVVIKKCGDYTQKNVYNAIKSSVDLLGGIEKYVKGGNRVLLKPNLLTPKPPEAAATTHPEIIRAIARLVIDAGGIPFIGDSPPLGSWKRLIKYTGMEAVAKEMGIDIVEFNESVSLNSDNGHIYKTLEVAREVVDADVIINLPKLKTHTQMLLTLGVKNNFGCVAGKGRKGQWHLSAGIDNLYFARMLVELYEAISPDLTIIDGIVGMEGDGPSNGNPRKLGFIVTGVDCVAMDVVITKILGARDGLLYTTSAARGIGVGETNLKKMEILGEKIEDVKIHDFEFPTVGDAEFGPSFLRPYLKQHLTPKPEEDPDMCTLCKFCIDACPPKIISKGTERLKFDYRNCIRCFCCLEVCPVGAMKVKQGILSKLVRSL